MKKIIFTLAFLAILSSVFVTSVFASSPSYSAFRSYMEIRVLNIVVPTVVEIPVSVYSGQRQDFLVYDTTKRQVVPHLGTVIRSAQKTPLYLTVQSNPPFQSSQAPFLSDGNLDTFGQFNVNPEGGSARIIVDIGRPMRADGLKFILPPNVALPSRMAVRAVINNSETIVRNMSPLLSQSVSFPEQTARVWVIDLEYSQPLRISEMIFSEKDVVTETKSSVRFLAQVGSSYRLYLDADKPVNVRAGERPNLSSNEGVLQIGPFNEIANPDFTPSDVDNDSVPDIIDNCVFVYNPDQADIDGNGRGDACDDWDRDGIINSLDNCPNHPNSDQKDSDADGIGDVCDEEENRITEKYPLLPWLGIGFAGLVIIILGLLTVTHKRPSEETLP